jgi:hypothetical protein
MKISLPRNDLTQPIIKVNFDKNSNNLPNYYRAEKDSSLIVSTDEN